MFDEDDLVDTNFVVDYLVKKILDLHNLVKTVGQYDVDDAANIVYDVDDLADTLFGMDDLADTLFGMDDLADTLFDMGDLANTL